MLAGFGAGDAGVADNPVKEEDDAHHDDDENAAVGDGGAVFAVFDAVQDVGGHALGFGFELADDGFQGVGGFGVAVEMVVEHGQHVGGAFVEFDV